MFVRSRDALNLNCSTTAVKKKPKHSIFDQRGMPEANLVESKDDQ